LKYKRDGLAELDEVDIRDDVGDRLRGIAEDKYADERPRCKDDSLVELGEHSLLYLSLIVDKSPESQGELCRHE